jgi:hypothetical protein
MDKVGPASPQSDTWKNSKILKWTICKNWGGGFEIRFETFSFFTLKNLMQQFCA